MPRQSKTTAASSEDHGSEVQKSTPDLAETFIILLISAAISIFLLWVSAQSLGRETFSHLPDWIVGTYKGIWTSVGAGAAGVGLAIAKAFNSKSRSHPHYLKYIGVTTACILVPIALVAAVPYIFPQISGQQPLPTPAGVTLIKVNGQKTDFDLENYVPGSPVTINLKGSFTAVDGILKGHLDSGKIKALITAVPAVHVNSVSFLVCYLYQANGYDQSFYYPPTPRSPQMINLDFTISQDASVEVPGGDFSFPLPAKKFLDRAWLCAALLNTPGFSYPAQ